MEHNFTFESAFKDCASLKMVDLTLPKFETSSYLDGFVKATYLLPIVGLPRLKRGKPRKTTYRTVKRFSAKRNK